MLGVCVSFCVDCRFKVDEYFSSMDMKDHSLATVATYFEQGVFAGILKYESVIRWADRVILQDPEPLLEIIDISFARSEAEILLGCKSLGADTKHVLAGKLLFSKLLSEVEEFPDRVEEICSKGIHIAINFEIDDIVYFERMGVAEELEYIRLKSSDAGFVQDSALSLQAILSRYAVHPENSGLDI